MTEGLEGRDLLTGILDMADQNRPLRWISRATAVPTRDLKVILKTAGYKIRDVRDLAMYDKAEWLLQDGASFYAISRTLHTTPTFLRTWFPGQSHPRGDDPEFSSLVRDLIRKRREHEYAAGTE